MFIVGVQHKQMAFLKSGNGDYVVGHGPFENKETAPESGVSFYCNDYTLSDPAPWKVPALVTKVSSLSELGIPQERITISWAELEPDGFADVFSAINEMITRGVIEKSVPVATERGQLATDPISLIANLANLGEPFHSYGWCDGERGFCGASPELLFNLDGQSLETMALAGTARSEERDVFAVDGKEIREHEFVAQTLVAKLSDIGELERAQRSILDLGKLVHFHTAINVKLFAKRSVDELIRRLHPTPALGPLPRTTETLKMLADWRDSLGCPRAFGAPFGLLMDGQFKAIVAIRSAHWSGSEVMIPAGCGVIEASRLVNEWRELRLKREAVKSSFGLG